MPTPRKLPQNKQVTLVSPLGGVDRYNSRESQKVEPGQDGSPPTCYDALNVLPFDVYGRGRIGQRPGISKYADQNLSNGTFSIIQGLSGVNLVNYQTTSLTGVNTGMGVLTPGPANINMDGSITAGAVVFTDTDSFPVALTFQGTLTTGTIPATLVTPNVQIDISPWNTEDFAGDIGQPVGENLNVTLPVAGGIGDFVFVLPGTLGNYFAGSAVTVTVTPANGAVLTADVFAGFEEDSPYLTTTSSTVFKITSGGGPEVPPVPLSLEGVTIGTVSIETRKVGTVGTIRAAEASFNGGTSGQYPTTSTATWFSTATFADSSGTIQTIEAWGTLYPYQFVSAVTVVSAGSGFTAVPTVTFSADGPPLTVLPDGTNISDFPLGGTAASGTVSVVAPLAVAGVQINVDDGPVLFQFTNSALTQEYYGAFVFYNDAWGLFVEQTAAALTADLQAVAANPAPSLPYSLNLPFVNGQQVAPPAMDYSLEGTATFADATLPNV